jgi:hypothetical protein
MAQELSIHSGAHRAERGELELVRTPAPTKTWHPIPHVQLIDTVKAALESETIQVTKEEHALQNDGANYFGILRVSNLSVQKDFQYVVGLRNSHVMKYPAGLVVGSWVFVCDNLSFSGEVEVTRKHTRFITRDLQGLVSKAVGFLAERWIDQETRINSYREFKVTETRAHDLIIRSLDARVITTQQVEKVLHEWREPQHEEFRDRNGWSFFNAFTEVLKGSNPFTLAPKTQKLHGLLDHQTGILSKLGNLHGEN